MPLPEFLDIGDLPVGIHQAPLQEVLARFGSATVRRQLLAARLERVYQLVADTGHLARFIVFGSFITNKSEPNDVDVFLLMEDSFPFATMTGETRFVFEHDMAQAHFGCSIFWLRRVAAFLGEQATVEHWRIKRDQTQRGIVEIIREQP